MDAAAKETTDKVRKVKAAYLLNFVRYSEWPDAAFNGDSTPFRIAVVGDKDLKSPLQATVKDQQVRGRSFRVRRHHLPSADAYADRAEWHAAVKALARKLASCHLVYLDGLSGGEATRLLADLGHRRTLTIGSEEHYIEWGTMIALGRGKDRIVFHARPDLLKESNIKASAQLLRLARIHDR